MMIQTNVHWNTNDTTRKIITRDKRDLKESRIFKVLKNKWIMAKFEVNHTLIV